MRAFLRFVMRVVVLMALSVALAALANVLRPSSSRIAWVEDWSKYIEARALEAGIPLANVEQTARLLDEARHVFFDARPSYDYEEGHLPGAISVPFEEVEDVFGEVQMRLTREQPILAYCSGAQCDESFLLIQFLREQGFTNVVLFLEGFDAWQKAGRPVERSADS